MKFYTNLQQRGNYIHVRGYEDGQPFNEKVFYKPRLFVPARTPSKWKTIDGVNVDELKFDSIHDAKDYIKQFSEISNFKLYGLDKFIYTYLHEQYPEEVLYDRDQINIAYIDIEVSTKNGFSTVEKADQEIISIAYKFKGTMHVFGFGNYNPTKDNVIYYKCFDEKDLLAKFITLWAKSYPDIVSGWNIAFFDIPYLIKRIETVLTKEDALRLSPWKNIIESKVVGKFYRESIKYDISGVTTYDYLDLYKKFTYSQQESYKLDHIAFVELGERKVSYTEYDNMHDFYTNDFSKFIDYNIVDTDLVERIEDKMKLIDVALAIAYDAKVQLRDVYTQVRIWDTIIHNHLLNNKICVPISGGGEKNESYIGAYVKDPQIGMHNWVVSFDLNSLYPSLIMQYNISPETIVSEVIDKEKRNKKIPVSIEQLVNGNIPKVDSDVCLAANGCLFKKDRQGFLPQIIERMYKDRVEYKNRMIAAKKNYEKEQDNHKKYMFSKEISRYNNLQMAKKIQLNSAYGALGNEYFRFFDIDLATAITAGGQLTIKWAENKINEYLNKLLKTEKEDYVLASDTDSLYITLDKLVRMVFEKSGSDLGRKDVSTEKIVTFLDKVIKERIEPTIAEIYNDLALRMEAYDQKMIMKREVIADKGIWTAKKRYILNVHDSEGIRYNSPKLKIMGIEAVKSSTPFACRSAITEALNIVMQKTEEDLQQYIAAFKTKFYEMPFEDVSFPRTVQNIEKYKTEKKSIPIHVRGALIYNKRITELKLLNKYELVRDGDKIKFCYLKLPNPIQDYVISALSTLPQQFGLEKYIDYETQFEKAFLEPLKSILNVIGWKDKKTHTLEEFFT